MNGNMIAGKRAIDNIFKRFDMENYVNEKFYHNTSKMLIWYSKVQWQMSYSIMEMEAECYAQSGNGLYLTVNALIDIDPRIKKNRIESRLESLEDSKSLLELIDCGMAVLKQYPDRGLWYFEIISQSYLGVTKCNENNLMDKLCISRSTLYRDRKKAKELLAAILWGFIIPDILNGMPNVIQEMETRLIDTDMRLE